MKAETFFTQEQKDGIVHAIEEAEKLTSGEIRVYIENSCKGDVLDRAAYLFKLLDMFNTRERNGVLFYISIAKQQFAVLGDAGIHAKVPDGFWDSVRDVLQEHFNNEDFTGGLSKGIQMAGEKLKAFFPRQDNDTNELSNTISFGEN
ncbi:MAG: TPM domain-containing protein [Bacteroidales bacterium]|nr:TPM domain-containing protein [Bacteroidales bacterium]MBN2763841.1 TPM domain-containing protein [Bacteroidales bacterium]